jgi:hypothetical protein
MTDYNSRPSGQWKKMYFLRKYRRGIKNKYRRGIPVYEAAHKDLLLWLKEIRFYFRNNGRHRTMLVYPHFPSRGSTIYKLAGHMQFNVTNRLTHEFELAVYWEYTTFREEYHELEALAEKGYIPVINLYSRNIGKKYIDQMFKEVFGYSISIDPLSFMKKCVRKSDINAKHDGTIIQCPIKRVEDKYVYQKLVDNSWGDDSVMDIRVIVIKNVLPYLFLKFRKRSVRFKNISENPILIPTSEILKPQEIENINLFVKKIQLEYGELDVLRDNNDGKIYIVDVNNTPQGPPKHTKRSDKKKIFRIMKEAFITSFLSAKQG